METMEVREFDLYDKETRKNITVRATKQGNEWKALCPRHKDNTPSLSINPEKGVYHCFGCKFEGQLSRNQVATYDYIDAEGKLLFQTLKYKMGDKKAYRVRRPDDKGNWIWDIQNTPRVLYHLPQLLASGNLVFIVEGEKDVETLAGKGLTATTNPLGAGKWRSEFNFYFWGKDVAILPDNDDPGREHAQDIAKNLSGIANTVRVVELQGLPEKGDVTDWLDSGHTKENLLKLVSETPTLKEQGQYASTLTVPPSGAEREFLTSVPETQGFKFIDLEDLLKFEEAKQEWVWEGILPADGLSLLVAKPKVGKTTFALNLAHAVACGKPFLGKQTRQGKVFYLALEESLPQVKYKMIGWEKNENLKFHFGGLPDRPIERLELLIEEKEPSLVVVDTLQKLVRVRDLNDYAQVSNALQPLMDMARKHNCHICLTHHNKKMETNLEDSILGSVGLQGGVDTTLHLKRYDSYRTFSSIQRYGENTEETVLTMNTNFTLTPGAAREEAEVDEVGGLILTTLTSGAMNITEIKDAVEKRKSICTKAVNRLIELGKVTRSGSGKRGDPFSYELVN